jgi:hypothetical protein
LRFFNAPNYLPEMVRQKARHALQGQTRFDTQWSFFQASPRAARLSAIPIL